MASWFQFFTLLHIASGSSALLAFWAVAVWPKNHWAHRRLGRVFSVSMVALGATSWMMSGCVLLRPEVVHPETSVLEAWEATAFLSYLGVASVATVRNGVWAARSRSASVLSEIIELRFLNAGALLLALTSLAYGIFSSNALFIGMSVVGFSIGGGYFLSARKPQPWLIQHLTSMVGGGVAAHTGLIAGGGSRFLPAFVRELGWVAWFLPMAFGFLLQVYWIRKYRKS